MPPQDDKRQARLHPVLTGRLGAQDSLLTFAQKLDKTGPIEDTNYVQLGYGLFDSLGTTNSLFKYGFDLKYPNSNGNFMHDALSEPGNIITISLLGFFLVSYSVLASLFEKEKEKACRFEVYPRDPSLETIKKFKEATYVLTQEDKFYYFPKSDSNDETPSVVEIEINKAQAAKLRSIQEAMSESLLTEDLLEEIRLCTNHVHERSLKKLIADTWPYVRDLTKALKNAYKGWRSLMQALNLLGALGINLQEMIFWGGIGLGVLASINRLLLRNMIEKRKVMMDQNAALLLTLKKIDTYLTAQEIQAYKKQIQKQPIQSRCLAYLGVAAGGVIDGLYLYAGVLSLVALTQPWFMALAALCALYTIACVISRIYEEYDYQLRLEITQTKCKMVLLAKRLETLYCELENLEKSKKETSAVCQEMERLLGKFNKKRELLENQLTRGYLAAALLGLKNGLYAYSALNSFVFFIAGCMLLAQTTFPPALLITMVLIGAALISFFIIHSLIVTYMHNKQREMKKDETRPFKELEWLKGGFWTKTDLLPKERFQMALQDGFNVESSPVFFYQEWAETIRSFFSGANKGQKFVDFAGNYGQVKDDKDHYRDSPIMMVFGALNALLFGLVFAGRALARGFGRLKIGCGLLRINQEMPNDLTIDDLKHLLNERCAMILFADNSMVYTDLQNDKLVRILPEESNKKDFEHLSSQISDTYKLADEKECGWIESLIKQKFQPENDLTGAVGSIINVPRIQPENDLSGAESAASNINRFFYSTSEEESSSEMDNDISIALDLS